MFVSVLFIFMCGGAVLEKYTMLHPNFFRASFKKKKKKRKENAGELHLGRVVGRMI